MIDKAILELPDSEVIDGSNGTGTFEFETDIEMTKRMRTNYLLDNSLDRILGALQLDESTAKRSGITVDVGGGELTHTLTFTEPSGGTNQWGNPNTAGEKDNATGESARSKAEVLMRYVKVGKYDSLNPARLKFGEYHEASDSSNVSSDGDFATQINCTISDIDITVSSEGEDTIEGSITLTEIGTPGPVPTVKY